MKSETVTNNNYSERDLSRYTWHYTRLKNFMLRTKSPSPVVIATFTKMLESAFKNGYPIDYYPQNYIEAPLLHTSCWSPKNQYVELLLDRGADVNVLNLRKQNALIYYCGSIDYSAPPWRSLSDHLFRRIVELTADVNAKDDLGASAFQHLMFRTCRAADEDIERIFLPKVQILMENGANVEQEFTDIIENHRWGGNVSEVMKPRVARLKNFICSYREQLNQFNTEQNTTNCMYYDYEI